MKTIISLIVFCSFGLQINAQVTFTLSSSPSVGINPNSAAAADVNGDGKVDLISCDYSSSRLTVLTNDGSGGFATAGTVAVGAYPISVTAADLNGDGLADLICANNSANTLSVLTNNGSGGFVLASAPSVGSGPWSVKAADLNGDARLELICANSFNNSISVLTNNGSCGFATASTFAVGNDPHSVTAADVNGDGKLDLISANFGDGTLSVLTNNGNGGFVTAGTYAVGNNPIAVVAADVDGNGKMDLISANYGGNSLSVLTNDGNGGFATSGTYAVGSNPRGVAVVDVNGDGRPDLASADYNSGQLSVFTNDGSGGFVAVGTFAVGGSPNLLITADVNGDGKVDMITPNLQNSLSVLTNGTPFPPPSLPIITTQPIGETNLIGTTATFSVGAKALVGLPQFSYQWQLAETNLPGATNNPLILTNLALNQSGSYDVVVSDSAGSVTSSPAILDVRFILVKVNGQIATGTAPALSPATVTISGGYPGGYLFYTLDGSTPTSGSTYYSGPITLTNSATVRILSLSADFSQTTEGDPVNVLIAPAYSLQTSVIGNGTLSMSPPTGPYLSNTVVTLSATPALHWAFDHWAGDANGSQNPLNLTMNGPLNVQAVFVAIPTFNLQTSVVGNGTLATSPSSGPYDSNSVVTLTAVPAAHWSFDHWTGDANGNQNPLSFTVGGPSNVQAVFVQSEFPLTLTTPGGGGVTANGQKIAAATYYPAGSAVSLAATAGNGWSFLGWQGDASGAANPLKLFISQTNNIQAVFGTVATTNSLGGGIILGLPNPIPYGTPLAVSAVPDPGNYFVSWNGGVSGTNSPARLVVTNANPFLSALFTPLPAGKYTLSLVVDGNGFVTNSPRRNYYNPGDSVTIRATTNAGAYFFGWTQDATGTSNPLTVSLTTNKIIQANFGVAPTVNILPLNLTALAGSNAVLSANALGLPPLAYQWQNNQGIIAGATAPILPFFNIQPTNAGTYSVVVSNAYGSATSAVATVTVIGAPIITNQPAALTTVTSGHAASFAVAAYGWPAPAYQWQLDGANLQGATNPMLTLPNAFAANAGIYTVVITNVYGSVTSSPARLTVLPLDIIAPIRLADGQFQFTFDTAAGVQYEVEYSTNLTDWQPLMTVGGNDAPLTLTDPNTAGSRQRYYRLVQSSP